MVAYVVSDDVIGFMKRGQHLLKETNPFFMDIVNVFKPQYPPLFNDKALGLFLSLSWYLKSVLHMFKLKKEEGQFQLLCTFDEDKAWGKINQKEFLHIIRFLLLSNVETDRRIVSFSFDDLCYSLNTRLVNFLFFFNLGNIVRFVDLEVGRKCVITVEFSRSHLLSFFERLYTCEYVKINDRLAYKFIKHLFKRRFHKKIRRHSESFYRVEALCLKAIALGKSAANEASKFDTDANVKEMNYNYIFEAAVIHVIDSAHYYGKIDWDERRKCLRQCLGAEKENRPCFHYYRPESQVYDDVSCTSSDNRLFFANCDPSNGYGSFSSSKSSNGYGSFSSSKSSKGSGSFASSKSSKGSGSFASSKSSKGSGSFASSKSSNGSGSFSSSNGSGSQNGSGSRSTGSRSRRSISPALDIPSDSS